MLEVAEIRTVSLLNVVGASCVTKEAEDCCACLVGKAPDGSDTTDGETNCLADDDASGSFDEETEKCPNTMSFSALIGGDNGTSVELKADACRETCFDACNALDGPISFETTPVSAGTFTATIGHVLEEATNVTTSQGPNGENFIVNLTATTPVGEWRLVLANTPRGPGSYAIAPFSDFGLTASTAGDTTGNFEVTSFDERTIAGTFSGTVSGGFNGPAEPVAFDGAFSVDFTLNDGDVSGIVGLQ